MFGSGALSVSSVRPAGGKNIDSIDQVLRDVEIDVEVLVLSSWDSIEFDSVFHWLRMGSHVEYVEEGLYQVRRFFSSSTNMDIVDDFG